MGPQRFGARGLEADPVPLSANLGRRVSLVNGDADARPEEALGQTEPGQAASDDDNMERRLTRVPVGLCASNHTPRLAL